MSGFFPYELEIPKMGGAKFFHDGKIHVAYNGSEANVRYLSVEEGLKEEHIGTPDHEEYDDDCEWLEKPAED